MAARGDIKWTVGHINVASMLNGDDVKNILGECIDEIRLSKNAFLEAVQLHGKFGNKTSKSTIGHEGPFSYRTHTVSYRIQCTC